MFKRLIFILLILVSSLVIFAQDDTYIWEPYGLEVVVPTEWVIAPSDNNDLLVLMPNQEALKSVLAGNDSELPVISIVTTGGVSQISDTLFDHISSRRRIEGVSTGGYLVATDFMPESQDLRTDMIQLNSHYMVFASAPRTLWDEFEPELDTFLDSIVDAPIYEVSADLLLTQPIQLGGFSLMMPADWMIASTGTYNNLMLLTSLREQIYLNRTFLRNELSMEVRDLTAMRAVLSDDILFTAQLFYFDLLTNPEDYDITPLGVTEIADTKITGIAYTAESIAGRAYYLRNRDYAYVLAAVASPEMWATSEEELFEAIWATLVID